MFKEGGKMIEIHIYSLIGFSIGMFLIGFGFGVLFCSFENIRQLKQDKWWENDRRTKINRYDTRTL